MFDARTEGTAGLTGVWAAENTRASIFDGMARKETFAVSGPHIKVRMFGGWEYDAGMMAQPDWVKTGYAKGVPMGGDLHVFGGYYWGLENTSFFGQPFDGKMLWREPSSEVVGGKGGDAKTFDSVVEFKNALIGLVQNATVLGLHFGLEF
jgi:Protein of unknown function (DUF3604)